MSFTHTITHMLTQMRLHNDSSSKPTSPLKRKGSSTDSRGIKRSSKRNKAPHPSETQSQQSAETKDENDVIPNPLGSPNMIIAAPLTTSESEATPSQPLIQEHTEAEEKGTVTPNKLGLTPLVSEQLALLDMYLHQARGDTALTAKQFATKLLPIYSTMQTELRVISRRLAFFGSWLPALMMYVVGHIEFQRLVDDKSIEPLPTTRVNVQNFELWRWFIENNLDIRVRTSLAGGTNQLTLEDLRHAHRVVSSKGGFYFLCGLGVCFYCLVETDVHTAANRDLFKDKDSSFKIFTAWLDAADDGKQ
jgi:hypothetical protein